MKQHIYIDQVKQLNKKQRAKLRDLWKVRAGDVYVEIKSSMDRVTVCCELAEIEKNEWLPLLSIGQMIEILIGERRILDISFLTDFSHCIDTKKLCNQLWNKVKEML